MARISFRQHCRTFPRLFGIRHHLQAPQVVALARKFPKPIWQTGLGVPPDGSRDVPDVSFAAAPSPDGYLICSQFFSQGPCANGGFRTASGFFDQIGGIPSAGVPTFAGVVALINQQSQSTGQGNINYILYQLATNSPAAFHDITSGNNKITCESGTTGCPSGGGTIGFTAMVGYDQTTGLGSPDVNNLVNAWTSVSSTSLSQSNSGATPDFQFAISPSTLSVTQGTTNTAQIAITAFNGFTGTPTFACSVGTALTGVTCQVNQATRTLSVTAPSHSSAYRTRWFDRVDSFPLAALFAVLAICYVETKRRLNGQGSGCRPAIRRPAFGSVLLLASVLLVAFGCGGGGSSGKTNSNSSGSNPPIASGSVAVTGTSGSLVHEAQISVNVN